MHYRGQLIEPSGAVLRSDRTQQKHEFQFRGTASDYTPIWFSNLALTILTLGLYSPWAKVRREKFFHNHTVLAGSPFDYTADPWKILKGRLIILLVFILYSVSELFSVWLTVAVVVAVLIFTPFIIRLALRFRTRYTSYRNMHFAFHGTYGGALKSFLLWPITYIFTLFLSKPYVKRLQRKYFIDNISYGGITAHANPSVGSFYMSYVSMVGIYILAFVATMFLFVVVSAIHYISGIGDRSSAPSTYSEVLEEVNYEELTEDEILERQFRESLENIRGLGFGMIVLGFIWLAFLMSSTSILRAMLAQATWNHSTLGKMRFQYSISIVRYGWIEFSNLLLRIITLGVASPYCAVRIYRYKVENLALVGPLSMEEFTHQAERELNALGDQAAEIYDVDFDFGL